MSDIQIETHETGGNEPKSFSMPIEIKGLHYLFEGDILTTPSDFVWHVRVPDWEKQAKKMEKDIEAGGVSVALPRVLWCFRQEKGSIGSIELRLKRDCIILQHIGTHSWALPAEFGYQNAEKIGSFLLKNATTFADIKGLPMFLEPYPDGSSPLSDRETIEWYQRQGFEWRHDRPDRDNLPSKNYGSMVRMPRQPDLSQPIAALLK